MTKVKLSIKNRWTGEIIFEYQKENNTIAETVKEYIRQEIVVKEKYRANLTRANLTDANLTDADLTDANLTDADLTRANLTRADLTRANLTDANLTDANLTRANLTDANLTDADLTRANLTRADLTRANLTRADLVQFKNDLWCKLLILKNEIPAFKEKIIEGKINGTCYEGQCACFIGTIANIQHKKYTDLIVKADSDSPVERWFLQFKEGQTPENSAAMKLTLEWIEELELHLK